MKRFTALLVTLAIIGCSSTPTQPVMAQAPAPVKQTVDDQIKSLSDEMLELEYQIIIGRIANRKLDAINDAKANQQDLALGKKVKAEMDRRRGSEGN